MVGLARRLSHESHRVMQISARLDKFTSDGEKGDELIKFKKLEEFKLNKPDPF